jgi:hypothetical protein
MNAIPRTLAIASGAAWRGSDLARRDDWIYRLSGEEQEELVALGRRLAGSGESREQLSRDDAALGALAAAVAAWRAELRDGLGFVLVRGMPLDRLSRDEVLYAYWALGLHLGRPVPQNLRGELLTDVRDTGADPGEPSTRLYKTAAEQDFHTDGADIIALLCLHGAKRGGESRIVSSVTVYNEIARRRPDVAPVLFEDFYWHYFEPEMESPAHFVRPICTPRPGGLNTSFIPWYIRRAEALPGVPAMSDLQRTAVELMEQTANEPELYLDMEFRPGDVQLLKNSVILHKRTAYEDFAEPERKRHLVRLWLAAPDFDDGDEQLRRGISLG